ncbi:peptidoglycan editing factor PgeF [Nocardioides mesophilus]|uniref:Purine nucleoside phosphorylase n=1 Tax=Nocardioides mesophilus TaxID=433659 RepID=A0A7G9RBW1_9ACTN|nr:peptidoglycan editing factor PgeF [Nocardioides mesophilus]QNN53086.1 peptidoglycan editing factor PgeF [Nocardioides mesophilus]
MFAYRATRGPVEVAFTDRHGGVSGGPYASLNLAARDDDQPGTVAENIDRVARALTAPVVAGMRQVHGAEVAVVDAGSAVASGPAAPQADALVTGEPGVALMVRVADCVPVLLADTERGLVAAVHSGRPGLVAGVVPAAVAALRELGAGQVVAWVGPHVCGSCYEVPEDMRAHVAGLVPETFARTSWGTPSLDLGAGVVAQLRDAGVSDLTRTGRCTREDEDLFSYRRQGPASGRLAGFVWVRP